jgi:choice-of-anchor B domain-containing protein
LHFPLSRLSARALAPVAAVIVLFGLLTDAGAASRNVNLLANVNSYPGYSACCSYVHADGREYACIGTQNGTAIYNIVSPAAPVLVGFINGPSSVWREMKQYGDHVYIVSEGSGTGAGLQIIRMTNPQAPVLAGTYTTTFTTAHTVTIDRTRGLLYANGANGSAGGMHILSLANPEAPVEAGSWYTHYVHDSHVRGNQLFVASIYDGLEIVLDVSNPAAPAQTASWTTPGAFTHNSWTSKTGTHLFTTDENATGFLTVYDITNLPATTEVARFSANPAAIVHNVRVKGDTAFVSYYTEGVRLLDISDPATPTEFGYYDTWPGPSGGFNGDWDVDPFFPSGVFIVSDMSTGLYVFKADPNYGTLGGVVTESGSGLPLSGVVVQVQETGQSVTTNAAGAWRLALDPGFYHVNVTRFGYFAGSASGTVSKGVATGANVSLTKMPWGILSGTITGGAQLTALTGAEIHLHETPLATSSGSGGTYAMNDVPEGTWLEEVERAGYVASSRVVQIVGGQTTTSHFNLTAMNFYDDVENDSGWSLSAAGDNATSGLWVRADPVGSGMPEALPAAPGALAPAGAELETSPSGWKDGPPSLHPEPGEGGSAANGLVQPEDDHTPSPGVRCFVTGNAAPGAGIGTEDVDNGTTTLTSPVLNLQGLIDPHVGFYYFYVNDAGSNPGEDPFVISVSNDGGSTWVAVSSILTSNHKWEYFDFRVADYVLPNGTVRVRFRAQDLVGGSIVEAAVDDFGFYASPAQSGVPDGGGARLAELSAAPNPFGASTSIRLAVPLATTVSVRIFDPSGRLVRSLYSGVVSGTFQPAWDGRDDAGRPVPGGLYFVTATGGGYHQTARLVRVR